MRKDGGVKGRRGKSMKGRDEDRDGDSCSTVEVIKTHKVSGGICVYLITAAEWKM